MINEKLSNVNRVNVAYNSVEKNSQAIIADLKATYEDVKSNHAWTQKSSRSGVSLKVISLLVVISVILLWEILVNLLIESLRLDLPEITLLLNEEVTFFVRICLYVFAIGAVYSLIRGIWCSKVRSYNRKIEKTEKKVLQKIAEFKSKNFLDATLATISDEQDKVFPKNNKLGDDIMNIREEIYGLRTKIKRSKQIANIIVAIVLAGIAAYAILCGLKPMNTAGFSSNFVLELILMWLFVTEISIVILMNLTEYLGKFTKVVGIIMTLGYGFLFHLAIKDESQCVLGYELMESIGGNLNKWFTISVAIPVLFVVANVLIICFTHIGTEVIKLRDGFTVAMQYGTEKEGSKAWVYFLGVWYVINVVLLTNAIASTADYGIWTYIMFGALWWAVNPLIRPTGSRLYAFWGRGRCIINEIVMFMFCLVFTVGFRDSVEIGDIMNYGIIVVISLIVGLIVKKVNDEVII